MLRPTVSSIIFIQQLGIGLRKSGDKEGAYLSFVAKTEKDDTIKELLIDDNFEKILKEFNTSLPLKRINEFVILKYLLNHDSINIEIASNEILKYINKIDKDSVIHAFEYLNHQYWDSSMIKQKIKLVECSDDTLYRSDKFTKIITDKRYRKYIEDAINCGIVRYEKEFQEEY